MNNPMSKRPRTSAGKHAESGDSNNPDYQALYRLLAENAREVVSRHSAELTFLYASPAAKTVLGHPADELIGHRLDDLAHPDDLAELASTFALASEGGGRASTVFRCRTESSKWRWCEISCRGVANAAGEDVEIQATIRDISRYKKIEKAIERVAREWRSTFDAAQDAIIMLDSGANILRVNLATLKLFQCEFRDLIGVAVEDALHEQLDLRDDPLMVRRSFESRAQNRMDINLPDREIFLRCSIDPIFLADGQFSGAVIFLSDITSEKQAHEQLLATLDEVRELSKHLQDIREQERRSIARELHDELGHMLTALKLDTSWLLNKVSDGSPEHEERGRGLLSLVNRTIESSRRIVTSLRPPVLDDLGLDAALDWLISDFSRHCNSKIQVDFADIPERLRGDQAITIFRIVQEALTNIRRHADANHISLKWKRLGTDHIVVIGDDGCGFDRGEKSISDRYGLLGISERVRSLNGELQLESEPGRGTTVRIQFPDTSLK